MDNIGTPLRGTRCHPGRTKLNPLIINIVVEVIICHWVGIMVENEARADGFRYTMVDKMTLFYAYYSLIDSTNMVWTQ